MRIRTIIISIVILSIVAGIAGAVIATRTAPAKVAYDNPQYGFTFALPDSWKGYSIATDTWRGTYPGAQGDQVVEEGPVIAIRHPLSTAEAPRQDIPIMVFTLAQWDALQRDSFHVGAAPLNPSELGRNATYVFALPARYNYAFPAGFEEVESILQGNPLRAY
jgi:hypothetical protein